MEEQLKQRTEESIMRILDEGITTSNLDHLYKLSKINHIAKEDKSMNYGNYGARTIDHEYGRESYRGYDKKYRGHEHLNRIYDDYGRFMDNRERYGNTEETNKSFYYMVKALEDFIKVLHEEADTQQEKQELMQALQNSMRV